MLITKILTYQITMNKTSFACHLLSLTKAKASLKLCDYVRPSDRLHVQHSSDAAALRHNIEGLIDLSQSQAVCDELVHLESPLKVVSDQLR